LADLFEEVIAPAARRLIGTPFAGLALLLLTALQTAFAQGAAAPVEPEKFLAVGDQPGPGMWMVGNGTNVLWIVGSQSPLPKKMSWRAKGVEAVVAKAQEVLREPAMTLRADKVGFFTALTLVPAALEAKNNPDGATLADVLPPPLFARWEVLRDKYIDEARNPDNTVDRMRPMFAALQLQERAIAKSGMTTTGVVWPVIEAAAKKHNVKISEVAFSASIDNARAALKEFNSTRLADVDCFEKTLDRIETDLDAMRVRANAWAVGDVNALRSLSVSQQRAACEAAFRGASSLKILGALDVPAQLEAAWMTAAETALANNTVTLAVLPAHQLLSPEGYLAKLKAKGYAVLEPAE
jgi:uncharacterized protein YbaP (TraB family)